MGARSTRSANRDVESASQAYERAQENRQIIEWRRHGRPYRWIAEQLGISHQAVQQRYSKLLAEVTAPAVHLLRQEALDRHEGLMVELREMAIRESTAEVPDVDLIRRILSDVAKNAEAVRKLMGLDAPAKVEATVQQQVHYVVEGVDTSGLK